MRSTKRSRFFSIPILCIGLGFLSTPAWADLQLTSFTATDFGGQGLGAVATILTLQSSANDTEATGCVGLDSSGQQTTTGCGFVNDVVQQQSFVRDITNIDAFDLRIVFNAEEPGNDTLISIEELVVKIYQAGTGAVLFTSTGLLNPDGTDATATGFDLTPVSGVGNSGYIFRFTTAQAEAINALTGTIYLGLGSRLSDAQSSNDTFSLGVVGGAPPQAIPEPASWLLMGGGLLSFAMWRRSRKA